MYDAVIQNIKIAKEKHSIDKFGLTEGNYYLATIHRAENTDNPIRLKAILESFTRIEYPVLFPLHPRTRKKILDLGYESLLTSGLVRVIEPVSYLEMLTLESYARGIMTDSGGVQKEAYFAEVPCYTLRDETEWVETIEVGWNRLVNPIQDDLAEIIRKETIPPYVKNLYGDGNASSKIVEKMMKFLEERS